MQFSGTLNRSGGALSGRKTTLALAALAAVAAGVLVLSALDRVRGASGGGGQATVLVTDRLIVKGTPAEAIAAGGSLRSVRLSEDDARAGAITDAAAIRGKVAATDIYPNQQLAATDFKSGQGVLTAKLAEADRAVSVPVDAAHGLIGQIDEGDHVDVYGSFEVQSENQTRARPVLKVLAQDVPVLKAPEAKSSVGAATNSPLTLKVDDKVAAQLAFAVDNGKLWVALRPASGARPWKPDLVTLESVLFGTRPIAIRKRGRR